VVLPQANTTSVYAETGTANHAEDEGALNAGDVPEAIAAILGDATPTARAEVALAYDAAEDDGRVIGTGRQRDYGELAPFEIPGTADVLAHDDERVYVVDRKLWTAVTAAERNVQVVFLALAAARALGRKYATVALRYETGRIDRAEIDLIDMLGLAARLRDLHGRVAEQRARRARGEVVDVREGSWCRYCPASHCCPAKVALVRRLVTGGEADELELMLPLDDKTAAVAYERLQAAKQLLKRIEGAIYARAAERPIPLGGNRYFGKHVEPGNEQLDGRIAHAVLRDQLGVDAADEAVTYEVTKTRIKAVIKARAAKGAAASVERTVLDAIRGLGGATRESKERVGEFSVEAPLSLVGGAK
jgi:hypothetical protein